MFIVGAALLCPHGDSGGGLVVGRSFMTATDSLHSPTVVDVRFRRFRCWDGVRRRPRQGGLVPVVLGTLWRCFARVYRRSHLLHQSAKGRPGLGSGLL